jgi:hypothetical protein
VDKVDTFDLMAAFFAGDLPEYPAHDSDYVESSDDSESSFPSSDEEDISEYEEDILDEEASLEYRDLVTDEEDEPYADEPHDEDNHIPYEEHVYLEEDTYLDEIYEMDDEDEFDDDDSEEPDYDDDGRVNLIFQPDQVPHEPPVIPSGPPTAQPMVLIPIAPYPNPNHQPFLPMHPAAAAEPPFYAIDQPTHIPIIHFPEPLRQVLPFLPAQQTARPQTPPITPDASRKRAHEDSVPPTPETTPVKETDSVVVKDVLVEEEEEEEEDRLTKRRRTTEWDGVARSVGQFTLAASLGAAATFAGLLWAAK